MSEVEHPGGEPVESQVKSTQDPGPVAPQSDAERWHDLNPDAVLGLNEGWQLLFANRAAREIFSDEAPLETGRPAWQSGALANLLVELQLEALKSSGGRRGNFRSTRNAEIERGGERIPVEVCISISGEARERIFTLVLRDVSHQTPADSTLYQSQKQQVIGALAGGVAHDFNNVLTAVICRLEQALEDRGLMEGTREDLLQALESARRGAELNKKLMAFSRRAESKPEPLDVARLVEETIFILRRTIDLRIQIQFERPEEDLWHVEADSDQLMQVLMNLCLNARDAMPTGGELTITCANREISAPEAQPPRQAGEFVRVTVSDTGHGMKPDVLARLFEPYFSTKGFGKGAGLGLSIANHVVVEHGGWMEAESQHEEGSRFHFFLPRTTAALPVKEFKRRRAEIGNVLKGVETILLVDDEDSVRSVITATLSYQGYKMVEAVNGEEAVERYRKDAKDIDLVLLDLQMPRVNGWDTLERILAINPRARVLLLSGGVPVAPKPGALDHAAGLLMKPFQSGELLRAVREVLDK